MGGQDTQGGGDVWSRHLLLPTPEMSELRLQFSQFRQQLEAGGATLVVNARSRRAHRPVIDEKRHSLSPPNSLGPLWRSPSQVSQWAALGGPGRRAVVS